MKGDSKKKLQKINSKVFDVYFSAGKPGYLWTQDAALIKFFKHVLFREDGVWEWVGARTPKGYGQLSVGGGKVEYAHRWIYNRWTGENIDDLKVCHKNDLPYDVNPFHLFAGTQAENIQDAAKKGRLAGRKPRGKAIAGKEKNAIIKDMFDGVSNKTISKRYGRSQGSLTTFKKRLPLEGESVAFVGTLTLTGVDQACEQFKQDLKPVTKPGKDDQSGVK